MALMSISELTGLTGDEREHLQAMEDSLHDVIHAQALAAAANKLDSSLLAKATITLLLTLAAREALHCSQSTGKPIDSNAFAKVATEAVHWAIARPSIAPNILH
jgi:hypothetical protein